MENLGTTSFLLTFILGGTILVGFFVIAVILKSKSLKNSRYFLACTLLFLLLHLDTFLLFTTQFIKQFPNLLGLGYPTLFLAGPSFYFFIKLFINPKQGLKKIDVLHLIPFIIILAIQLPFYFESNAYKMSIINYYYEHLPNKDTTFYEWLRANMHMIHLMIYTIISFKFLNDHDKKNHMVLKKVCIVLISLSIIYALTQTSFFVTGVSAIIAEIVLASLLAITILLLSYWIVDIKNIAPLFEKRYKTSPLSTLEMNKIEKDIMIMLTKEKIHLDSKLKIKDLANNIGVPSHHISQVLNESMGISFYDLINKMRVDEVKEKLLNGALEKISTQGISEECGFSNKNSFYRAFKKFTGTTPIDFVKNN